MDPIAQLTGLVAAISAMAGFIVWMFKEMLRRADEVLVGKDKLIERQQAVIDTQAESNKTLAVLLEKALAALQRIEHELGRYDADSRR